MRLVKRSAVLAALVLLLSAFVIHASALDDTYRFDSFGMSLKLPKSDYVITRDTPRGDEVFSMTKLDYDETMTAFKAANIYLRAYDPDGIYQISLTVTSDENSDAVNNYSDLTAAERKSILDAILSDATVSSAVEVKHNGNIFFDSERVSAVDGKDVYINQCNTVINGMQIDLMLQKADEAIAPDEAKALTNAANSLSFDTIRRSTGPIFEWWRLLLWVAILAGLSVGISVVYKQYNAANKRKLEERRQSRRAAASAENGSGAQMQQLTFEETLGYRDDEEFAVRADADEMATADIKVREQNPAKGVAFFEDEGSSIDDGTDYFDTYFKEPVEKRTATQRFFSRIGMYLSIAAKHTGYFFKNLFKKIFGKKKKS